MPVIADGHKKLNLWKYTKRNIAQPETLGKVFFYIIYILILTYYECQSKHLRKHFHSLKPPFCIIIYMSNKDADQTCLHALGQTLHKPALFVFTSILGMATSLRTMLCELEIITHWYQKSTRKKLESNRLWCIKTTGLTAATMTSHWWGYRGQRNGAPDSVPMSYLLVCH